ncbi:hypothetical protein RJ639_003165 [Escallonia herrerae]|uniref:Uncharacterized protein n=1 Tax=Escallonia herrerae TaxID=1293975 RepID=A0AA88W4Y2_9ASTE|nr:hypothetical protein RJ639_003165 [Escallonia herrerae]
MVSSDTGGHQDGNKEFNGSNVKSAIPLHMSTSQRGLISDEDPQNRLDGSVTALPKRMRFLKFGSLASPSARFQRIAEQRDEFSRTVPSSTSHVLRQRFSRVLDRKIDWASLWKLCKEWIRNPTNMVLFVWIVCVAVSGAILFLVMTGMLNAALPKKSQRDAWFEVNNQILNALFTLMCLYQHPKRIYHLVLLLRWRSEDISKLRKIYCKNGTYKPHEWAHMMVVIGLLNLNCFAQYALCGLNVGYKRSARPAIGVGITISVAIGAPAIAGVYSIVSPLGKDYHSELDEEAQIEITTAETSAPSQLISKRFEKRFSFASRDEGRIVETRPRWSGGEVRTGNSYDIVEDKFYRKELDGSVQLPISPLPRENGDFQFRSGPSSPLTNNSSPSQTMKANSPSPSRFSKDYHSPGRKLAIVEEESYTRGSFLQELADAQDLEETNNRRVVLALYDALSSSDVDTVHKLLAPDLEWWFHGPPSHQFMMRLLTGTATSDESFEFVPQSVSPFGSTVLVEGCDHGRSISWIHAWTVTDGIITQVREYFNTSLTVTRFGASNLASAITSLHCPSIWESSLSGRVGKSVPGLVLAI